MTLLMIVGGIRYSTQYFKADQDERQGQVQLFVLVLAPLSRQLAKKTLHHEKV